MNEWSSLVFILCGTRIVSLRWRTKCLLFQSYCMSGCLLFDPLVYWCMLSKFAVQGSQSRTESECAVFSWRLVSTDAAARGIDINGVKCVVNYDAPQYIRTYIHRSVTLTALGFSPHSIFIVTVCLKVAANCFVQDWKNGKSRKSWPGLYLPVGSTGQTCPQQHKPLNHHWGSGIWFLLTGEGLPADGERRRESWYPKTNYKTRTPEEYGSALWRDAVRTGQGH